MEGKKMQSVQLQLSLIDNEKERLVSCLDSTIERARRLSSDPRAAGRLMRDSQQLLSLLSGWADAAETELAELYADGARQPPAPPAAAPPPVVPPAAAVVPRSAVPQAVAPQRAVSAASSRPPRAASDLNATLESAVSFHTAVPGGSTRASTRPQSPASRVDTPPDRPQRTPDQRSVRSPDQHSSLRSDQHSARTRTPTAETSPTTPPPPATHKTSASKKSNGEVNSIISRHLLKKKTTPERPKEVTQKPPPLGVETRVVFSYYDEATNYTYLSLWEDQDMLTALTEQLRELALRPARVGRLPRQGELVIAAWKGAWYRARVMEVFDNGDVVNSMVALQYIDYGNSDHQAASEIRFLPDTMKEAPAAAYKCKLVYLKLGDAAHWPLQRRLLLALADGPDCRLHAVLRRSQLPELYEATLISDVTVGKEPMRADVVSTLNAALLLDPVTAAKQMETDVLELRPLLVPYRPPSELTPPVSVRPEQPPEEKVLSWLAGQTAGAGGGGRPRAEPPPPASRASRSSKQTAELDMSFTSAESRPSRARRSWAPPEYSGLQLVWTARPIEQPLVGDGPHHVLALQVYDPAHFYLAVRSDKFDAFEERLSAVYRRLPLHPEQAVRDLLLPGSYWVARWERTGEPPRWCRCVIIEEQPQANNKESPKSAEYPVLWVDYGDTARLPANRFRPMTEEFAAEPLFAIRARCAGIYPVDEMGERAEAYSEDAVGAFRDLLHGRACQAVPVPSESTAGCQAVLLEVVMDETSDLLSVTEALLDLRAAGSFVELESEVHQNGHGQTSLPASASPRPSDIVEWDPMGDDFISPYNRPDESNEAEVAGLTGRDDPDDPGVCPVYASGRKCWDGIACRKRHVRGGDQAPPTVLVHSANREPLVLPPRGVTVYVKVSEVTSPSRFHVQLPFGAVPAQDVNDDLAEYRRRLELDETLESLSAAMCTAYGTGGRRHYSAACRPAIGEVLVAPYERGWHRGIVTDHTDHPDTRRLAVEVFLVDHGVTITRDAEDLKEMRKEFNLLPYQAVQCSLASVSPVGGAGWSRKAVDRFVQLVKHPCLLAKVEVRRPDGQLELELYAGQRPLSQLLVKDGLAERRRYPTQPAPVGRLRPA